MAFAVTLSSVWFPATVVTATTSSSGLASASRRAIASSWPGSQSMITGVFGMAHHSSGPRVQTLSCTIAALRLSALSLFQAAPAAIDRQRPSP